MLNTKKEKRNVPAEISDTDTHVVTVGLKLTSFYNVCHVREGMVDRFTEKKNAKVPRKE